MKKVIVIVSAAFLLAAFPLAAHAAQARRRGGPQGTEYPVCAIESCEEAGVHTHGGRRYAAHTYGDGHDYHDYHGYCGVEDCTRTGYHEHDGAYCFGNGENGGGRRGARGGHCC